MHAARLGCFLVAALGLAACAHTTNQALCDPAAARPPCDYSPNHGYRFNPAKNPDRTTLMFLTFSGGGIRAAALAYGTLLALSELDGANPDSKSLLDDVDLVSSVSGGSVTAAWLALKGRAGLHDPDFEKFLHNGGTEALAWRGLNPAALVGYAVTNYQRSDVLADYFADRLFGKSTDYRAVKKQYETANQPFVVLNATDFGHGSVFPFTQNRFDLLCSDLNSYRLSDAVAASANFPVVFSPIGLKNFNRDPGCPAPGLHANPYGPGPWIESYRKRYDRDDSSSGPITTPRSNGLLAVRTARDAIDYFDPARNQKEAYVHLLDGGLVDNLGVLSTLLLEDEAACSPGLFQRLARPRPDGYARFKEILYIVVNARTRKRSPMNAGVYPPDMFSSLFGVIDTSLDATINGTQNYLTAELQAMLRWVPYSNDLPMPLSPKKNCRLEIDAARTANAVDKNEANDLNLHLGSLNDDVRARIVTIDFEMIPDPKCRDAYWKLDTSWGLDSKTIDQLMKLPKVMLRHSGELRDFYKDRNRPGTIPVGFPLDYSQLCAQPDS
jgi:NTE family protein